MTMRLHSRITRKELESEKERFDFLQPVLECIERVDEVHSDEDNDSEYIFLVWLKRSVQDRDEPMAEPDVIEAIERANLEGGSGWWCKICGHECGFFVIYTWL